MNVPNHENVEQVPPLLPTNTKRRWLLSILLILLMAFPSYLVVRQLTAGFGERTIAIVASYRNDFRSEQPAPGWAYFWNQNGPVGETNGYVPLIWIGNKYATSDQPLPTQPPARFLRLSERSGHPGQGVSQASASGSDDECAIIVGFTVPQAGHYIITNSFIVRHDGAMNGSVHLQVFINERDTSAEVYCRSRQGVPFDRDLGTLAAGDTIYVSVGPGEIDRNDSFGLDFAVGRLE